MIGSNNSELGCGARRCAVLVVALLVACDRDSPSPEGKPTPAQDAQAASAESSEDGRTPAHDEGGAKPETSSSEGGSAPSHEEAGSSSNATGETDDPATDADSDSEAGDPTSTEEEPGPVEPLLRFESIDLEGDPTFLTHFEFLPGGNEFLAITRHGQVLHYALEDDQTRLLGEFQLPDTVSTTDCGAIGLALDPKFEDNQVFYVSLCFDEQHSGVVRYVLDTADYGAVPDTAVEIIRVGDDSATRAIHNVGKIAFDAQGNMFTGFGEKGIPKRARAKDVALGKLARFRPRASGGYDPPKPPNDFLDDTEESKIAYATGLRSPWTVMQDSRGRFWIGDVGDNGDNSREKINLASEPGVDFGWGLTSAQRAEATGLTSAIRSWKRRPTGPFELDDADVAATNVRVAWVGPEYPADSDDDPYADLLDGMVIYGDMCLGFVRGVVVDEVGEVVSDMHLAHMEGVSAWQLGPEGVLYGMTYTRCTNNEGKSLRPGKLLKTVLVTD